MRIFFLDDDWERHSRFKYNHRADEITTAWDHDAAIDLLAANDAFDVAYLDHDLGLTHVGPGREMTGADVAKFIADMPAEQRPKRIIIHSWNSGGALRMQATLRDVGVHATLDPFSPLL